MRYLVPILLLVAFAAHSQEHSANLINLVEQRLTASTLIKDTLSGSKIESRMIDWKVNGLSLAVINDGALAWTKVYGLRNAMDTGSKLDTATLFQCASIGKIVTTLAALYLVDKGYLTLDEDVNNKLLSWKIPENDFTAQHKVTLRDLLTHTAGLMDGYGFLGYAPGEKIPSLLSILNAIDPANNRKKLIVGAVPGSIERYSGGGFIIIQQLIEDITKLPFENFVDSVVFKPLGMIHSTYNCTPDKSLGRPIAIAHRDNGKPYKQFDYRVYPEKAATGFWSTATDLARLMIGIQKMRVGETNLLGRQVIGQMLRPQINAMGLGVHLKGDSSVAGFWHAGNNAGFTGIVMATCETGQGAVVLTNSNRGEWLAMEILRSVAKAYDWPITLSFLPTSVPEMAEYCGSYATADKKTLKIDAEKERLYFTRNGNKKKFYIYQIEKDNFRITEKPDNLLFIFKRDREGRVIGLSMYENAGQSHFFLDKL
ncbi:serine hydrolase [Olivibacter sp. 47]|uniref:serine hydrolase domain-containing protein n=1 Tax=Olivibacter sp. 47 TaxID=3056486 RepID=UPI0025A35385|nr:serine hydrolase [Olivibacter sp. 47]MDM8175914.1 serine hydrolase [Olivibacter sp. 47]